MTIEPFNSYVIVKKAVIEEMTASGIFLPTREDEDSPVWQGDVVYSSDDHFKKDDTLLFNRFLPVEFDVDGVHLLALKAEDIIARLCKQ